MPIANCLPGFLRNDVGLAQVPPLFVFHGADDAVVPVQNSRLLVKALQKHEVREGSPISPEGLYVMSDFPFRTVMR